MPFQSTLSSLKTMSQRQPHADASTGATRVPPALPCHEGIDSAEMLVNEMEASDPYLRGHSERVALLATLIAERLGVDPATVADIHLAGRLQDVGMSRIRQSVLQKPDVLSPAEVCHVREHVSIGVELLAPLVGPGHVLDYVHDHHERFDGKGYPRGLAGADISLGGRILAAADAFDALTSRRPYRGPLSWTAALSRLAGDVGRALDPAVFGALRGVVLARMAPPAASAGTGGQRAGAQ